MEMAAYLARIGLPPAPRPTLADLHERHLLAVPFENLDIHAGKEIVLDEEALLEKIVGRRRGGFCYELNGAFAWLLRRLDYRVTLLAAEVARADGTFGIPFDHLTLRVDLERAWLVDVGFGDAFRYPVPLDGEEVRQLGQRFAVRPAGEARVVVRDDRPLYRFTLAPRALADFAPGCHHHQTSPESTFTQGRICSLALPGGRVTLKDDRLIEIHRAEKTETPIPDEETWRRTLRERFDLAAEG